MSTKDQMSTNNVERSLEPDILSLREDLDAPA